MKAKTLRIPSELQEAISLVEKREHIEESTAMRKLLRIGYETYVGNLYQQAEITLEQASHLLSISRFEALDLFLRLGISGNLRAQEVKASLDSLEGAAD